MFVRISSNKDKTKHNSEILLLGIESLDSVSLLKCKTMSDCMTILNCQMKATTSCVWINWGQNLSSSSGEYETTNVLPFNHAHNSINRHMS